MSCRQPSNVPHPHPRSCEPRWRRRGRRGRESRGLGRAATIERRARGGARSGAHPGVEVSAARDGDEHLRRVGRLRPSVAGREACAGDGRERRARERDERPSLRVLRECREVGLVRQRRGGPRERVEGSLRDLACARAAGLPCLEGRVERVGVLADAVGEAGILRHPALLEAEFVRPSRSGDEARH